MRDLTIRELRAVTALGQELHFGRAAARLHTTQPAFSRLIQSAEKALGVPLFERSTRSVALTPAGRVFLAETRQILDQLNRAQERAKQVHTGNHARLTIGAIEGTAYNIMPSTLARFQKAYPEREIECLDLHTAEQLRRLRDGKLTWAVVRSPVTDPAFDLSVAYKEELVLAVPAARDVEDTAAFSRFAGDMFVAYHRPLGTGIFSATVAAAADAGFVPTISHYASSTAMLLSLVSTGAGVAVVSRSVSLVARSGVKFVRIAGGALYATVLLAWRKGEHEPALGTFLRILREEGEHAWSDG